jgi:LCP family protein required for cell wall assembly
MGSQRPTTRARRSAFAAAFLSFLFPGLGHAYLGRWLRALAWAALPILAIAAIAGLVVNSADRYEFLVGLVTDDTAVTVVLAGIVVDLLYRLASLLDAYRLARDPAVGSAGTRMLSAAGLVGIILVLIASHVAVAQPVIWGHDRVTEVFGNSGDDTAVPDLGELGPNFQVEEVTPAPEMTPETGSSQASVGDPTPTPEPTPTPSVGPGWDGKERLNILLIGADGGRQGPMNSSYLTDTMIVVSVDPKTGRVAFISLPRDTSDVPLPRNWAAYRFFGGKYSNKINTLYTVARGRPDLFPGNDRERGYNALMGALSELYGIRIDHYVAVELNTFRRTVNALGGVVVDVQLPVMDQRYPTADGRGKLKLYVRPGLQFMNGQQALAFARARHATSDFDRAARQQLLLTSLRDQTDLASLFAPGVIDRLLRQVTRHVRTNIPPRLVPRLVSLAQDVDLNRRETLVLSSPTYSTQCYPCPPNGLFVLKANVPRIRSAVQNVFSGSVKQERQRLAIQSEGAVVHVLNGQGGPNTKATKIAETLVQRGLITAIVPPVADGRADRSDYKETVITAYNGARAEMPKSFVRLRSIFKGATIEEVEDASATADFRVIVGSRTQSLKPR